LKFLPFLKNQKYNSTTIIKLLRAVLLPLF